MFYFFSSIFFFFFKKEKKKLTSNSFGKEDCCGHFLYSVCVCHAGRDRSGPQKGNAARALLLLHSFISCFFFFCFLFYCVGHVPLYYFTRWVVSYGQISRRPPTETLRCARPTRRPLVQTQIHAGDVYCGSEFVSAHRENVRFISFFSFFFLWVQYETLTEISQNPQQRWIKWFGNYFSYSALGFFFFFFCVTIFCP